MCFIHPRPMFFHMKSTDKYTIFTGYSPAVKHKFVT
jgi:hypothetical protein